MRQALASEVLCWLCVAGWLVGPLVTGVVTGGRVSVSERGWAGVGHDHPWHVCRMLSLLCAGQQRVLCTPSVCWGGLSGSCMHAKCWQQQLLSRQQHSCRVCEPPPSDIGS